MYWVLAWSGAAPSDYGQMAMLVALAIAAQHFPLTLTPQYKVDIAIGVYFTCLLLFGPPAAMILVGVSQVIGQRRWPCAAAAVRAHPDRLGELVFNTSR